MIFSSPYQPQTNGVCEAVHKEIRKYIYSEYFKFKKDFILEDELFNIIKIHNNKVHSKTKQIPKEIKDLDDKEQFNLINKEILKVLEGKNKNFDIIDFNKCYVFDSDNTYMKDDKILKKKVKNF